VPELNRLRHPTVTLAQDELGLTTVEYVIVLVLIAVGAIGLWRSFGGAVNARIQSSTESITNMKSAEGDVGQQTGAGKASGSKLPD
jgi:Flp pilus assembly pilin Flp